MMSRADIRPPAFVHRAGGAQLFLLGARLREVVRLLPGDQIVRVLRALSAERIAYVPLGQLEVFGGRQKLGVQR